MQPVDLYPHPRAGPISSTTAASLAFNPMRERLVPTWLRVADRANPRREELWMKPLQ